MSRLQRRTLRFGGDALEHLQKEVRLLKDEIERHQTTNEHILKAMNEMATDICRLDKGGNNTEFCRVFQTEFQRMQSKKESPAFRGRSSSTSQPMSQPSSDPVMFSSEDSDLSDSDAEE